MGWNISRLGTCRSRGATTSNRRRASGLARPHPSVRESALDVGAACYFHVFLTVTSGNCPHILRSLSREGAQHLAWPALWIDAQALGVGHVLAVDPYAVQADRAGRQTSRARAKIM